MIAHFQLATTEVLDVRDVVLKCVQSLHVINVLRRNGMNSQALQTVYYRSVVHAKLLYASSAWWGFTTTDDRQRIEAVVRCGVRTGLYPADGPTAAQLVDGRGLRQHAVQSPNELRATRAACINFFLPKAIITIISDPDHTIFPSPVAWTTVTSYLG